MLKIRFTAVLVGFVLLLVGVTGCEATNKYQAWDDKIDWVWENCELQPQETYMINIDDVIYTDGVLEMNCEQLHEFLPIYHKRVGDNLSFIYSNWPQPEQPPKNLHGLKHAYLSLSTTEETRRLRFVRFDNQTVLDENYGTAQNSMSASPPFALNQSVGAELQRALEKYVSGWPVYVPRGSELKWGNPGEPTPIPSDYGIVVWRLAIVTEDCSVYYWASQYYPDGFDEVYEAFQNVAP